MNETVILRPLLPVSASSFSFLDLLVPPVLIFTAFLLHVLFNSPNESTSASKGHVYQLKTSHARYSPAESKHSFSYKTVFLGVDLSALESNALDVARLFKWNSSKRCILALHPEDYLNRFSESKKSSIIYRLTEYLLSKDISPAEMHRFYMVTMPSYLGFHGINPLTVYFTYSETSQLCCVVLEVHNTFGERHLYVCRPGADEDEIFLKRYATAVRSYRQRIDEWCSFQHQWTFSRSFHVSPFNDRSGYYQVSVVDPFGVSHNEPYFHVQVVLLDEHKEKKLMADLRGYGRPISESSLTSTLITYPLALFLTMPRILYQATKLHYRKKLDVFPKPDPHSSATVNDSFNPAQKGGLVGNVYWQASSHVAIKVKEALCKETQKRVDNFAKEGRLISVKIVPTNYTVSPTIINPLEDEAKPTEQLVLEHSSDYLYTDFLQALTPAMALETGKREGRWSVSDETLFLELFRQEKESNPNLGQRLRARQIEWSLSFLQDSATVRLVKKRLNKDMGTRHLLNISTRTLLEQIFIERLTYWAFAVTRSRFVAGSEPWMNWSRALT